MRRHLTTDIISPHAKPDQKSAQEDAMHPLILHQLAADRVAEMIARADNRRQERQAPSLPAGGAKSHRSLTWLTAEAGSAQPTGEPASS